MSTELTLHRMQLNSLPLMLVPSLGLAGYALGGMPAAFAAAGSWCVLIALATAGAAMRYTKHRSHGTWVPGGAHPSTMFDDRPIG